jgi:hypothetical protein
VVVNKEKQRRAVIDGVSTFISAVIVQGGRLAGLDGWIEGSE